MQDNKQCYPKSRKLNNGHSIPTVGLGTWQLTDKKELIQALESAYKMGYKLIDTAMRYDNEEFIGEFLTNLSKKDPNARKSLFITTKLWISDVDRVEEACKTSLSKLKIDYIDLYLLHFPANSEGEFNLKRVWTQMESLVAKGLVKSIGVSNFGPVRLKELLEICTTKPVMNQVELHPYLPQNEIMEFCNKNSILVTSYSTLGSSNSESCVRNDKVIKEIAQELGITPSQVLLSYAVTRGCCVIPRSKSETHQRENMELTILNDKFMKKIADNISKRVRYVAPDEFGEDVFK